MRACNDAKCMLHVAANTKMQRETESKEARVVEDVCYRTFETLLRQNPPGHIRQRTANHFYSHGINDVVRLLKRHTIPGPSSRNTSEQVTHTFEVLNFIVEQGCTFTDSNSHDHTLLPQESRLQRKPFVAPLFMNVRICEIEANGHLRSSSMQKKWIGHMPAQVYSNVCTLHNKTQEERVAAGECRHDRGCYYIPGGNGKEYSIKQSEYDTPNHVRSRLYHGKIPYTTVLSLPPVETNRGFRELCIWMDPKTHVLLLIRSFGTKIDTTTSMPLFLVLRGMGMRRQADIAQLLMQDGPWDEQRMKQWLLPSMDDDQALGGDGLTQAAARTLLVQRFHILYARKGAAAAEATVKVESDDDEDGGDDGVDEEEKEPEADDDNEDGKSRAPVVAAAVAVDDDQTRCENVLRYRILPHIGDAMDEKTMLAKHRFLAYMVHRLLLFSHEEDDSSRDWQDTENNMGTRSIASDGDFLQLIWNSLIVREWSKAGKTMAKLARQKTIPKLTCFSCAKLTMDFCAALTTGRMPHRGAFVNSKLMGDSEQIRAINPNRNQSLRTLIEVSNHTSRHESAASLDNSQYGIYCPSSTPEKEDIGRVHELCTITSVTMVVTATHTALDETQMQSHIRAVASDMHKAGRKASEWTPQFRVILNDRPSTLMKTPWPLQLARRLVRLRQSGDLAFNVSVSVEPRTSIVWVRQQAGLPLQPFFVVDPETRRPLMFDPKRASKLLECYRRSGGGFKTAEQKQIEQMRAEQMLCGGIDWLTLPEIYSPHTCVVSSPISDFSGLSVDYDMVPTHCRIVPEAMSGFTMALRSSMQHQDAARVMLYLHQLKNATEFPSETYHIRADTEARVLAYPQKTLSPTLTSIILDLTESNVAQTAVVAITDFETFVTEDGIIAQEDSIRRGMTSDHGYKSYSAEIYREPKTERKAGRDISGVTSSVTNPKSKVEGMSDRAVAALPRVPVCVGCGSVEREHAPVTELCGQPHTFTTGLPVRGTKVESEQIIIGVLQEYERDGVKAYMDGSTQHRGSGTHCFVHSIRFEYLETHDIVHVKVYTAFAGHPGLKVFSDGQKCTFDRLIPAYRLPFTEQGIVPDFILGESSLAARRTHGLVVDSRRNKSIALAGRSTPSQPAYMFRSTTRQETMRELHEMGFHSKGVERMRNPQTGELMPGLVQIGIIDLSLARQKAEAKLHVRGVNGGAKIIGSQAVPRGKGTRGGFRIDEMMRRAIQAQGCVEVLHQYLKQADGMQVWICTRCGLPLMEQAEAPSSPDAMVDVAPSHDEKRRCAVCKGQDVRLVYMSGVWKEVVQLMMTSGVVARVYAEEVHPDNAQLAIHRDEQALKDFMCKREASEDVFLQVHKRHEADEYKDSDSAASHNVIASFESSQQPITDSDWLGFAALLRETVVAKGRV